MSSKPILFLKRHAFFLSLILLLCTAALTFSWVSKREPSQRDEGVHFVQGEDPTVDEQTTKKEYEKRSKEMWGKSSGNARVLSETFHKEDIQKGYERQYVDLATAKNLEIKTLPTTEPSPLALERACKRQDNNLTATRKVARNPQESHVYGSTLQKQRDDAKRVLADLNDAVKLKRASNFLPGTMEGLTQLTGVNTGNWLGLLMSMPSMKKFFKSSHIWVSLLTVPFLYSVTDPNSRVLTSLLDLLSSPVGFLRQVIQQYAPQTDFWMQVQEQEITPALTQDNLCYAFMNVLYGCYLACYNGYIQFIGSPLLLLHVFNALLIFDYLLDLGYVDACFQKIKSFCRSFVVAFKTYWAGFVPRIKAVSRILITNVLLALLFNKVYQFLVHANVGIVIIQENKKNFLTLCLLVPLCSILLWQLEVIKQAFEAIEGACTNFIKKLELKDTTKHAVYKLALGALATVVLTLLLDFLYALQARQTIDDRMSFYTFCFELISSLVIPYIWLKKAHMTYLCAKETNAFCKLLRFPDEVRKCLDLIALLISLAFAFQETATLKPWLKTIKKYFDNYSIPCLSAIASALLLWLLREYRHSTDARIRARSIKSLMACTFVMLLLVGLSYKEAIKSFLPQNILPPITYSLTSAPFILVTMLTILLIRKVFAGYDPGLSKKNWFNRSQPALWSLKAFLILKNLIKVITVIAVLATSLYNIFSPFWNAYVGITSIHVLATHINVSARLFKAMQALRQDDKVKEYPIRQKIDAFFTGDNKIKAYLDAQIHEENTSIAWFSSTKAWLIGDSSYKKYCDLILEEKQEQGKTRLQINDDAKAWADLVIDYDNYQQQIEAVNHIMHTEKTDYCISVAPEKPKARPQVHIEKTYPLQPCKEIQTTQPSKYVPLWTPVITKKVVKPQIDTGTLQRVKLKKLNIIVGDQSVSNDYTKMVGQNVFYTRVTGITPGEKATIDLPNKIFYIKDDISSEQTLAALRYAKAHKKEKILILVANAFDAMGKESSALLYAYAKTLYNLPNVTALLTTTNAKIYDFIQPQDKYGLLTTEIDKNRQLTGKVMPGKMQESLVKKAFHDKNVHIPKELRQAFSKAIKRDQGYASEAHRLNNMIYAERLLALLIMALLLLGCFIFFVSGKKKEES